MRLGTWNLLHGMELATGQCASSAQLRAAAALLDCDILAIQEVDQHQPRSGLLDQTAEIAAGMGASDFFFAPSVAGTPGEDWIPHHDQWDGPRYGVGLISRRPVKAWHQLPLTPARVGLPLLLPSPKGPRIRYVPDEPRVAIAAEFEDMTVACVHLSFVPGRNVRQLRQVVAWLKQFQAPRILMGDFNLPGGIPARVSKLADAAVQVTYPSWKPRAQFDHILVEEKFSVESVELPITGISDHLPLIITTK